MNNSVSIVILNYNNWKDTIRCLESIATQTITPQRTIVVDNHSTDNSEDMIRQWMFRKNLITHPSIQESDYCIEIDNNKLSAKGFEYPYVFIRTSKNGGYGYGNNIGIKYTQLCNDSDYIWILNNDTYAYPDTLQKISNEIKNTNTGVVGCIHLHPNNPDIIQSAGGQAKLLLARFRILGNGEPIKNAKKLVKLVDYPYGASLLISLECIQDVGYIAENYFIYFEEIDFIERIKKKGYNFTVCYNAFLLHKKSTTINAQPEGFAYYYYYRNLLLFYFTHRPALIIIPILKTILNVLHNTVKNRKLKTLDRALIQLYATNIYNFATKKPLQFPDWNSLFVSKK